MRLFRQLRLCIPPTTDSPLPFQQKVEEKLLHSAARELSCQVWTLSYLGCQNIVAKYVNAVVRSAAGILFRLSNGGDPGRMLGESSKHSFALWATRPV